MPRIFLTLLGVAFLVGAACSSDGGADNGAPVVVATTSQIGALVREVAGDAVEVQTLMGPGVDPHDYEPSPQDVRVVAEAALVLRNGIGLDDFLDDIIEGAEAQTVVTVTEGIELRSSSHDDHDDEDDGHDHDGDGVDDHAAEDHDEEEHEDEHDHGEFDAHVWHNPMNVKVMTANIVDALVLAFPERADDFRRNGEAYSRRLDAVDVEIRAIIDEIPAGNRRMVTDHEAFGYFVERYGLEVVGTVIPGTTTQAEASAQDIAALEDEIRASGVKAIFSESSVDPRVAQQVAADTGIEIVDDLYGDTLGAPGSGAETVDGMLLFNARRIADVLK